MTKFALPVLILCIFALFSYSVTSQSNDAPPDLVEQPAGPTAEAETASQNREQLSVNSMNGVGAEVQRLSDEVRANSDKIAQTATLRSDLIKLIQESKSSSDKFAQSLLDQINATRSEQVKLLKDANEAGEKAAQGLRDEVAASQAKFVRQIDAALKADTDRAQTLAQRVDVMKKDIEDLKKNIDEDLQNQSNISPGFALFAALAALALGPFLAYQLTANQLTRSKQQAAATVARSQTAKSAEVGPPLAPKTTAEDGPPLAPSPEADPEQETSLNHEAHEPTAYLDADGHPQASTEQEKV